MKIAIYARYSTDMQSEASIEDQIRICKIRAEKEGWDVVQIYTDYALSGASMIRAGIQGLVQDALAQKFDIVLAEDLDRISRDMEDIAGFYKRMEFSNIKIFTLSDGIITDLHIGLKGTMSARFLKDLADKVRRGLRGRVENGKSGGGKCYGYDVVHRTNPNGGIDVGERKINSEQAAVVKRIFLEYLKGRSPKKIALGLNEDGISGPSGRPWGPSTIYGNRERGTGILNNELYIGRMIWNRLKYVKDPDTRKRVSRLNPKEEWVIKEIPHLRIIEQEVWDRLKEKQGEYSKKGNPKNTKKRPPKLLSYLIKCGVCGGGCSMVSKTHYGCSTARNKGTCDNRRTIKAETLELSVINALQTYLMDKKLCAKFCREYTEHLNALRRQHNFARRDYELELAKIKRENEKLVEAILDGVSGASLKEKSEYIVKRREELEEILENIEEAPVIFHPNMADRYHEEVSGLIKALNNQDHREEAAELIRALVDKIVLTPTEDNTGLSVDLIGDLAGILLMATKGDKLLTQSGLSFINQSRQDDDSVNKDDMVAGDRNTQNLLGDYVNKDSVVAETRNTSNLSPENKGKKECKVSMVAGVGFEPTTFRL
ncbi:MAG: resolvase [Methyloligella sp.]|nr:MAG: resolvase [Methyloligella sp.]